MKIKIAVPPDFSFIETLTAHGWCRLPPFVWREEDRVLERTEALPSGVVLLKMSEEADHIMVEAQGEAADGPDAEAQIVQQVRRMLQLDLPMDTFHRYCLTHPALAGIVERRQGRLLRSPTLFEDTVKVIATTNTTWAQTIAMTARLVQNFGTNGQTFPSPQQIAAVPFDEFAARARMGYRNAYVHAIASAISTGSLDLEAWQDENLTATELRKRLLSLPGIGPYGAACLMLYRGRPAHVNADSVARALLSAELGRAVTDKEVHAFFEPYGEWRGLVYNFYPWRDG